MSIENVKRYDGIIREYVSKYPNRKYKEIAEMIIADKHLLVSTETLARYFKNAINRSSDRPEPNDFDFENDIQDFPDITSFVKEIPNYNLEERYNNILVLSDIHIPFHSNTALKTAIRYGKEKGVNCIVLNGDVMDAYSLSRFDRDPLYRDFTRELTITKEFLIHLREYFGKQVRIIWKDGNHEIRYERYLNDKAPEIAGSPELMLENRLRLHEFGIDYVENRKIIKAGKLNIMHGNEFGGGGGGVNPARGILLKSFTHTLFGHFHRTGSYTQRTADGSVIGSYATGCLCDLNPHYMPYNQWNFGFAQVHTNREGHYRVHNKKIVGTEVY